MERTDHLKETGQGSSGKRDSEEEDRIALKRIWRNESETEGDGTARICRRPLHKLDLAFLEK